MRTSFHCSSTLDNMKNASSLHPRWCPVENSLFNLKILPAVPALSPTHKGQKQLSASNVLAFATSLLPSAFPLTAF